MWSLIRASVTATRRNTTSVQSTRIEPTIQRYGMGKDDFFSRLKRTSIFLPGRIKREEMQHVVNLVKTDGRCSDHAPTLTPKVQTFQPIRVPACIFAMLSPVNIYGDILTSQGTPSSPFVVIHSLEVLSCAPVMSIFGRSCRNLPLVLV